jgi:hypothetical protein
MAVPSIFFAVLHVSHNRMADFGEMHSDLMLSAGQ